jgi:hypothetical protein
VAAKMKGKLEESVRKELIEEGRILKERLTQLEKELTQIEDILRYSPVCFIYL